MGADRRIVPMTTLLLGITLAAVLPAAAADVHQLSGGSWRLDTPLGPASGPFLLIENRSAAMWRCEIAVAEDGDRPTRDDLRHRTGRGWTLVGNREGGFVQPWSEPWRQLGPSATDAFRGLLEQLVAGDPAAFAVTSPAPRRWRPQEQRHPGPVILNDWEGLPASWRPPVAGVAEGGALRRRLVTRGRGRGGEGLVLDLRWDDGELVAKSARWPGRVTMSLAGSQDVVLPDEAFLPLWPLAEFLP